MIVRARTPVRADFAGGWTDVALFAKDEPGVVINAAINICSEDVKVFKLPVSSDTLHELEKNMVAVLYW